MKNTWNLGLAFLAFTLFAFTPSGDKTKELEIGDTSKAFEYEVLDAANNAKPLQDYAGENGLLVVFSSNTCPFVVAWEDRYNDLAELARNYGINMVLLNSNEAFRGDEDSPVNMREHAANLNYSMPYLRDDNHRIADAFGAKTTPHVFLFDNSLRLAYKGAIDDNYKSKDEVEETYAANAITALGEGVTIPIPETKAMGCSIKRVKK